LRLNLIWPIAIAILVAITLRSKEAETGSHLLRFDVPEKIRR